ncbi:hypothetical protein [Paenibacillus sp. R14(2021)]|uniref:hypothetical protein n=1 Tax=Paenibacillus sp. R14(2021) TaxID=2859228 RepID=UPI001C612B75|nr:hypothetical protein [Paenibacillus sp. R14(2021)]
MGVVEDEHSKRKGRNIYIIYNISIHKGNNITVEQRAECGGQINRNVGTNANKGGQNALFGRKTANFKSNFANGNGRSGIAGKKIDEQSGQGSVKRIKVKRGN